MVEVVGTHHTEDRPEALGDVELAPREDARFDPRAPQVGVGFVAARFQQPLFPGVKLGQRPATRARPEV